MLSVHLRLLLWTGDSFSGVHVRSHLGGQGKKLLSYACFQSYLLSGASPLASSLGQKRSFSVEETLWEIRWHRGDCCFLGLKAPKASSQQPWIH